MVISLPAVGRRWLFARPACLPACLPADLPTYWVSDRLASFLQPALQRTILSTDLQRKKRLLLWLGRESTAGMLDQKDNLHGSEVRLVSTYSVLPTTSCYFLSYHVISFP